MLSGLIKKPTELVGEIEDAQTELRLLIIDLDNIDAAIRIFDSDIDLAEIKAKPLPPRNYVFKGEVSRIVFAVLRQAKAPVTAHEIAHHGWRGAGSIPATSGS